MQRSLWPALKVAEFQVWGIADLIQLGHGHGTRDSMICKFAFFLGMVAIRGTPVQKYYSRVVGSLLRTALACKFTRVCCAHFPSFFW